MTGFLKDGRLEEVRFPDPVRSSDGPLFLDDRWRLRYDASDLLRFGFGAVEVLEHGLPKDNDWYPVAAPARGGGIWVGKHYGKSPERYPDPVGGHSHAATVRQVLRFFLLLEQEALVSPEASRKMREIFASPEIPHDNIKFVKGLAGRDVQIIRKWGTWQEWRHDAAVVTGPGRHYILVALTRHPKGDEYLVELARAVDDELASAGRGG